MLWLAFRLKNTDTLRVHSKSQKYRYRNLISQVFEGSQSLLDVGVICNFKGALSLSLPIHSRHNHLSPESSN